MFVHTHHQLMPVGPDRMELACFECGPAAHRIVVADRSGDGWTVSADGADSVAVADRAAAIDAMTEMALSILPDDGYATTVPRGLRELP